MQSVQMTQIASKSMAAKGHVIICGYGRCGQNLARLLDKANMTYIALDLDPDRVRKAAAAGDSVVFGDAARAQALTAAGLARASAVVITYIDTASALKVLAHIQHLAPDVPVVVRTLDDVNLDKLQSAGATEVVPEAIEASLMLASHALALVGVPMRKVLRMVQEQREARYNLLRGYFHGEDDQGVDALDDEHLSTFTVPHRGASHGQALSDLELEALGVRVVSVRSHGKTTACTPDTVLQEGDTLVLSGKAPALALAEDRLVAGG
jgi:CPA2 family monovalent cation:H+ antiporter-2